MTLAVTINGRFLKRQATGVDRFAFELLKAWWPAFHKGRSAILAMPNERTSIAGLEKPIDLGLDLPVTTEGRLQGHAWEQLKLPALSRESVLLNLCNSGPITYRRQIVVLHDAGVMATPSSYSFAYRNWHRWLISEIMKRTAVVTTVSKFSALDITRYFGGRKSNIEVVYESGEHVLREPSDVRILERLNLIGRKYVLAVGSSNPNKNLIAVRRASELLTDLAIKFVATGGSNQRVFAAAQSELESFISTGYVTNGELRALYENAQCFVFPSYYEGFGLPPLEAMHCGCPVVTSNRASMPEICGDAALYCEPDDPVDIANKLRRILTSSALSQELREAGYIRARQFSWNLAAKQFEEIFSSNFVKNSS